MKNLWVTLTGWGLAVIMTTTASWALTVESGDLQQYLTGIEYGQKGDAKWQQQPAQNLVDFRSAFDRFLDGEYTLADR